jgi:aldose 1-epimerase
MKRLSAVRSKLMRQMCFIFAMTLICARAPGVVTSEVWGSTDEGAVNLFTLTSPELRVRIAEYGARVVSIEAPDRNGHRADVVLGYNNLAQYVNDPKDFFGAIVGRYGNRIAKGLFSLDGKTYHVPINNKGNALHGGPRGFSSRLWHGRAVGENTVELSLTSVDGDMGFPGTLTVRVRYTLAGNRLRIDYSAETDKTTVVNLTNHTYFNLAGEESGDILDQKIRIQSDRFTPIDETLVPTGALMPVTGTAFDFRQLTAIGARIDENDTQLRLAGGYDHNFIVLGGEGELREAAYAVDPKSDRTLTVLTTEPGVQFYSGNFLSGTNRGYSEKPYQKHAGFCLETQHYPDSPNHPTFPSTVLLPGKARASSTVFIFGIVGFR